MQVELNPNSSNNYQCSTPLELYKEILKHRGLNEKGIQKYIDDINNKKEHSYNLLDNIHKAVDKLLQHISNNSNIHIIVDSDVDGYTSACLMYLYLIKDVKYNKVTYSIHKQKKHGISNDIVLPKDIDLLIIPDASSNETEMHKLLHEKGIDIIILDHHNANLPPDYSLYATIVNNQTCSYPNKTLSGVGIVYKFLQALDENIYIQGSYKYLDLVALGLIADGMSCLESETMLYVKEGLNNIQNHLFLSLLNKISYSTNGIITPLNVAFYVVPIINAIIRIGTQEEKELLWNAFCENYQEFEYKKRGSDEIVIETIYERVARIGTNVKSKQKRMVDKALSEIEVDIDKNNKVITADVTNYAQSLTGLIAVKLVNKYKRPAFAFRVSEKNNEIYSGSGRNVNNGSIKDLQTFVNNSFLATAEGHSNAFGIKEMCCDSLPLFIDYFNKNTEITQKYIVDFIIDFENLEDNIIYNMQNTKQYYAKGIEEPIVFVKNITINPFDIELSDKKLEFVIDGVKFIKFNPNNADKILLEKEDDFNINVVGKLGINTWNGVNALQMIVDDFEVIDENNN